jgi:hypothetical protein
VEDSVPARWRALRDRPAASGQGPTLPTRVAPAHAAIFRDTRSATITHPRQVLPEGIVGITDASTTRRPLRPWMGEAPKSTSRSAAMNVLTTSFQAQASEARAGSRTAASYASAGERSCVSGRSD